MTFHETCLARGCDRPAIATLSLEIVDTHVGRFATRGNPGLTGRLCAGCEHHLAVTGSIELKPERFE